MRKLFIMIAAAFVAVTAMAQENPMMKPVPMDPEVRYGHLPNGLTYYVRHNETPKNRCEFHIAQAVGAILEEDHQNGLAHFLEHMCFNGTEHFPGKKIIEYFESKGVSFGGDINAYTSLDETVYRLSNVPTTNPAVLDSALLVLYDWSCAVSLLGEEIDNERGVIREEWRTGNSASRRMYFGYMKMAMPGSQYAKRDVIGDTAVINNFSYQAIRDYYEKWYGPDLQAIVVVGDIDVDEWEQKIIKLFSPVEGRAGMTPRTRFNGTENAEPITGVYLDDEAQYQAIRVGYKFPRDPKEVTLSLGGYIGDAINNLMSACFSKRFRELIMDPNANFTALSADYDNLAGETDCFEFLVMPKDGKEVAAYRDLCYQIEKLRRYGITQSELDMAKEESLASLEKSYNERNKVQSQRLAQSCYRHFLDNSGMALTSREFDLQMAKQFYPVLTVEMVNAKLKEYISDKNMYIIAVGKSNTACKECGMPTGDDMLKDYQNSRNLEIAAPKEEVIDKELVKKAPKAGKIVAEKENSELGTTEWTLQNGIKVIIKQTDFKSDEIMMNATSWGGYSKYNVKDLMNAQIASSIVEFNGIGTFDMTALQKALTGIQASVSPSIGRFIEEMSGTSTVKDFESMLKLNYLYFTSPRQDDKAFGSLMSLLKNQLAPRMSNPKTEFSDRINKALYANSDRIFSLDTNNMKGIDQKRAIAIYKERFANPADFTFMFVGNIDPKDAKIRALIEQWLGGMKTTKKFETWSDDKLYLAEGGNYVYFKRDMKTKTASNRVYIIGKKLEYNLANSLNMEIAGNILGTRYLESIREREGGSYGVGTYGTLIEKPVPSAYLIMNFDTDPDKQNKLLGIIYDEVETIIENGPLATDLNKEKENLIKVYEDNLRRNDYWMNTILYNYYFRNGLNYLKEYRPAVEAITGETVQNIIKSIYEEGNRVEVVMMPTR